MIKATSCFNIITMDRMEGGLQAKVTIDPEHDVFKGHFPGNPVLPGVMNIEILQDILRNKYPMYKISEVNSVKFLKPVRPIEDVQLHYDLRIRESAGDTLKVTSEGTQNGEIFVKVQMSLIKH